MEDMVEIMEDLQQYVPTRTTTSEYQTCGVDSPVTVTLDDFHYVLFGKKQSLLCIYVSGSVSRHIHLISVIRSYNFTNQLCHACTQ